MAGNTNFPQSVRNAMGELIIYALANADSVDGGVWLTMDNITIGDPDSGTKLGDWKVTIKRTSRPALTGETGGAL